MFIAINFSQRKQIYPVFIVGIETISEQNNTIYIYF